MINDKRYIVTKNAKTDAITYMEYDKLKGLDFNPKNKIKYEDMINVNKMIVINPSFIEKLVDKKCKKTLTKVIKILSTIYDDDEDSGDALDIALDELSKFKSILIAKYQEYMEEKKFNLLIKKIEILEQEIKTRKQFLFAKLVSKEQGKGR
ncbi:MAG TPA: hypothetical protein PLT65_05670 [Bacilli bacterium]|nr:hypothetical protein [Bacilli bacterium]